MDVEVPAGNFLRPNGLGGYIVRQSDLDTFADCGLRKFYRDRARNDPNAPQGNNLSATGFGTVIHYVLQNMEKWHNEGREDALEQALKTFRFYWHPDNMGLLDVRIDTWIKRQTWGGLQERGLALIEAYWEMQRAADTQLLACEYKFAVPIKVNGRTHTLQGTIDRLEIAKAARVPVLQVSDYKTGRRPTYLRYNQQFSAYCFATSQPEFWRGWTEGGVDDPAAFDDETLGALERSFASWGYNVHAGQNAADPKAGEIYPLASRRGRWIDLQAVKFTDAGWRNERDYARLHIAIDSYVRACESEVYPMDLSGETCTWCAFRQVCGGVALPPEEAGAP